jgi:hypothetical protein
LRLQSLCFGSAVSVANSGAGGLADTDEIIF